MMHSFLIVGCTHEERKKKAYELLGEYGVKNPTFVTSGKKHLIKDIRDLTRSFLYALSEGETRGVILENADLMTAEAANSFLKTLEEPPANTILLLTSPSRKLVLETISSRCQVIDLGAQEFEFDLEAEKESERLYGKLIGGPAFGEASWGERFGLVEKLGVREKALEFVLGQIFVARKDLIEKSEKGEGLENMVRILEKLEQVRKDLEANVNPKIALTELFLSLNK